MTTARSSPPDLPKPPWARLVELAVVVPVEVSGRIVDAVPFVVDKVPAAVGRVRREIVLARFLGKLAVDQGVRELRSRLEQSQGDPGPAVPSAAAPAAPSAAAEEPLADTTVRLEAPDPDSLALVDYDHLSSAQIVAKLAGLDAIERKAIQQYELAGRHRRTILGKLDQLDAHDHNETGS